MSAGFGRILALNGGSSSLKFALYGGAEPAEALLHGSVERIGLAGSLLSVTSAGKKQAASVATGDHAAALDAVFGDLDKRGLGGELAAAGHRILHGGEAYLAPHRVDGALVAELKKLSALGPDHMPAQISLLEAVAARKPGLPQVACFDTAFHRDLPRAARLLALPLRYDRAGVRRYGFHGLSYEFLMEELAAIGPVPRRIILAHLGNGASMAAILDGKSVDTTMGFTPAAGLVMGQRPGDIDPGLPAYLARSEGMTAAQFDAMANHASGLIGLSETSSDMRELLALEGSDPRAVDAVEVFCRQAAKAVGALAAVLGGVELVVFAGGIGENSPQVRARICSTLGFLGITIDPAKNGDSSPIISADGAPTTVRVIRTDEERMIARATGRLLGLGAARVP